MILACLAAGSALLALAGEVPLQSGIREEVRVDLRFVDFLVVDRAGRPVTDLRRDEVRLWDEGQEQVLLDFVPSVEVEGTELPSAAPRRSSARVASEPPVVPSPRAAGRSVLILLDAATLSLQGRIRAGEALADLLERQLRPEDRAALLVNDEELRIVAPLGTPHEMIVSQLRASEGLTSVQRDLERRLREAQERAEDCRQASERADCARQAVGDFLLETARETETGLARLEALIRSLGAIPERKILFYVSEGLITDPGDVAAGIVEHAIGQLGYNVNALRLQMISDFRSRLDGLYQLASSSRTSFFPVNTLRRMTGSDAFAPEHRFDYGPEALPQTRADAFETAWSQAASLHRDLATSTGGVPLFRWDPGDELERLLDASRGGYSVSYRLKDLGTDRRKIRIEVARKRVKVHYRDAYRPEARNSVRLDGELLIGDEVGSANAPGMLLARLRVLGSPFALAPASEPPTSLAAVYFRVLDEGSRQRASHFEIIAFPRGAADEAGDRHLERPFSVRLPSGEYTLHAEVRDVNGGAWGSFERRIQIGAAAGSAAPAAAAD